MNPPRRSRPKSGATSRHGGLVLGAVCLAVGLLILWPLNFTASALHDAASRLVGLGYTWHPDPRLMILNFTVFIPIGLVAIGVTRWPVRRLAIFVVLFSAALEISQIWLPGRILSPDDPAFNVAGAMAGALLVRLVSGGLLRVAQSGLSPLWAALLGMSLVAGLYAVLQGDFASLRAWVPQFPIQLGNEATGNRPWRGRVSGLEIETAGRIWTADSLGFSERCGSIVGPPPCDGPMWLQGPPPRQLIAAVRSSGRVSVRLRAATARIDQGGPARIVSISSNPDSRDLTIGQEGPDLIVRIRRRWAGSDGERPYYHLADVFRAGQSVPIAVDASSDSTVIVAADQRLVDRHDIARQWWMLLFPRYEWRAAPMTSLSTLPFWALLLGPIGLITGAAAAGRRWTVGQLAATCVTCSVLTWLLVRAAGVRIALDSLAWIPLALTSSAVGAQAWLERRLGKGIPAGQQQKAGASGIERS